jgi:hypothetical protein
MAASDLLRSYSPYFPAISRTKPVAFTARTTLLIFASPSRLAQLRTNHSNTSTVVALTLSHVK